MELGKIIILVTKDHEDVKSENWMKKMNWKLEVDGSKENRNKRLWYIWRAPQEDDKLIFKN